MFLGEPEAYRAGGEESSLVLGVHRTDRRGLQMVGRNIGDRVIGDSVRASLQTLLLLGAYGDAVVATVPLGEGECIWSSAFRRFGLYKEPVGFIIDTAIGLSNRR